LLAVPLGRDAKTGYILVAAAHTGEGHVADEIAYHLGTDVMVSLAPLGAVLDALGLRTTPKARAVAPTPASGTRVTQSLGSDVISAAQTEAAKRESLRPSRSVSVGAPPVALAGSTAPPPVSAVSAPPSPSLVPRQQVSIGPSPSVMSGAGDAAKLRSLPAITIARASTPPSEPPPETADPVIRLTRPKSLAPGLATGPTVVFDAVHGTVAAPMSLSPARPAVAVAQAASVGTQPVAASSVAASSSKPAATPSVASMPAVALAPAQAAPPVTVAPKPAVAPSAPAVASKPAVAPSAPAVAAPSASKPAVASASEPSTAKKASAPAQPAGRVDKATLEAALQELSEATTPERVVTILVYGLESVARKVMVLAARSKVFEGRETSHAPAREFARTLSVPMSEPSILLSAVQSGRYVGPVPRTSVHSGLVRALGEPSGDVAIGIVTVQSRPALVYVVADFERAALATQRGDVLAKAASAALERIVRNRKK
jgi:hypothetical protein